MIEVKGAEDASTTSSSQSTNNETYEEDVQNSLNSSNSTELHATSSDPTSQSSLELAASTKPLDHRIQNSTHESIPEEEEEGESSSGEELQELQYPKATRSSKFSQTLPTIESASKIDKAQENDDLGKSRKTNQNGKRKKIQLSHQARNIKHMATIEPLVKANTRRKSATNATLPMNQYECILQRRAIRKKDEITSFISIPQPKSMEQMSPPRLSLLPSRDDQESKALQKYGIKISDYANDGLIEDDLEIEGDTSLGMKLTILSGKVIVQNLMPLQDGRASPAQLTGMVSRGDVLLSIDDKPLVGAGLDLLVQRLKPLSTANENGEYKRYVKVRFAVGEGLSLLKKDDNNTTKKKKNINQGAKRNKFNASHYAMVDQWSGTPFFQHDSFQSTESRSHLEESKTDNRNSGTISSSKKQKRSIPLQDIISIYIASEQRQSKTLFTSAFFSMSDHVSPLLRGPSESKNLVSDPNEDFVKKKEEMIAEGKKALTLARSLYNETEIGPMRKLLDPLHVVRSECRSFSSRSRFSQKYSRQASSDSESSSEEDSSHGSTMSGNLEDEIGDEMLLRLAVWNKTWKRRMVETLEAASVHTKDKRKEALRKEKKRDDKLEVQLQNLFFGSEVTEMINKKKPTVALPPDEITEVLFDLAMRVTATIPTNVNFNSNSLDITFENIIQNDILSSNYIGRKADQEVVEATRFLLDDILPAWLETFKPIPPKQRRVVWPLLKEGSSVATPDDELSMGSAGTNWSTSSPERRSRLEDRIAHLELDPDTRVETCKLVTFYFSRKIIGSIKTLRRRNLDQNSTNEILIKEAEEKGTQFIQSYGSYLDIFESLVAAADSLSSRLIEELLNVANYDPTHIDCMKMLKRNSTIVLYEQKFLSAILFRIREIFKNPNASVPENLLPLLAAAYPDLKPWQIRSSLQSFTGSPEDIINDDFLIQMETKEAILYYIYLSLLMESNHMARMDEYLVKEWCVMSISDNFKSDNEARIENFMKVANADSTSENEYYRDLSSLLDMSSQIKNTSLSLQFCEEVITSTSNEKNTFLITKCVTMLSQIAFEKIKSMKDAKEEEFDLDNILHNILELFDKLASIKEIAASQVLNLPEELSKMLQACTEIESLENEFAQLIADKISPYACLDAISMWSPTSKVSTVSMIPMLQKCLTRSLVPNGEKSNEISFALSNIRKASERNSENDKNKRRKEPTSIWEQMEQGDIMIRK